MQKQYHIITLIISWAVRKLQFFFSFSSENLSFFSPQSSLPGASINSDITGKSWIELMSVLDDFDVYSIKKSTDIHEIKVSEN